MTSNIFTGGRAAQPAAPFSSSRISASRVDKYLGCGVAFKRHYIDGEIGPLSGSAALFGTVMHKALETWALNRELDLVSLVAQAWITETQGTIVQDFLAAYQQINIEVMHAEHDARKRWEADPRNKGKVSKAPRMTKYFKESAACGKLNSLLGAWLPRLNEQSPWRFTDNDPLPSLYDESLRLGKQYAFLWYGLPNAIHTEFGFNVDWFGFTLNGYIDNIEPKLSPDGEIEALLVTDYKTYRKDPPPMKDWRQGCIYDIAVNHLRDTGVIDIPDVPIYVVFDYVRLGYRRDYLYTDADRQQLLDELNMYRRGVNAGLFLPAQKNSNPDFCDYPDCCLLTKGEGLGCRGGIYEDAE